MEKIIILLRDDILYTSQNDLVINYIVGHVRHYFKCVSKNEMTDIKNI